MPRPDTSNVTEEEVEALFGSDGDDGEIREPKTEESEEETEVEASAEEEPAEPEEEESDDSTQVEEPTELNWDEVPENYKTAFEEKMQAAERWQKAHSKLQSDFTKRGQAQRDEERNLQAYRQKADIWDQWEAVLGQHPEIQRAIEREFTKLRDPMAGMQIPDHVKSDPAFQAAQQLFGPQIQRLEAELRKNQKIAEKVTGWEAQQATAANKAKLDGLLNESKSEFKARIGREPSEAEMTQVLQFMVENQYYRNGKLPVLEVFGDRIGKAREQMRSAQLKEKAKKFAPKNKAVNSSSGRRSQDAATPEEAVAMALADQGYGT